MTGGIVLYIVFMQFHVSSIVCMLLIPEYAEISIIFYLRDHSDQESPGNTCNRCMLHTGLVSNNTIADKDLTQGNGR